ncbi:MAG: NAD(P)/FAD-dependent oxidoreductase [Thermoanaerobaculum sp.]
MGSRSCDVLILGGGPAGSTAATLLAEAGFAVTVLEKEPFPRFHVGESLLPHSLPLFDRLGVHEAIEALPHTRLKPGAVFATADGSKVVEYRFAEAFPPAIPHAYQVRRDEFDALLLSRAQRAGAEVLSGWEALTPQWEGKRLVGLRVRDPQGQEHTFTLRAFLDASGQKAFMATRMGWRFPYPRHRKVAAVSHFRGVWLPPGEARGNITIVLTKAGWFWFIPFADDTVSVGAVLDVSFWQAHGQPPQEIFQQALKHTPEAARRLAKASPIIPFSAIQNFSYRVTKLAGEGFCLVGDAAGFLDPIFSTGVFIATTTAASAAEDVADALHRHGRVDAVDLAPTVTLTRNLQKLFFSFIRSFYDRDFLAFFFHPRPFLKIPAAIVSLLAADVVRPGRWTRLSRFHLLQLLAAGQRIGRLAGRPLVPPLDESPAETS